MFYNSIFDNYIFDLTFSGDSSRKKREREKAFSFITYLRQILTEAVTMIEVDSAPDTLDIDMLELFRYCNGHVGIYNHPKHGMVCFPGSFSGEVDCYGRGERYTGALLSGEPIEFHRGVDGVVIANNPSYTADLPLMYSFSKRLAEVDTSLDLNVFFARLAPIVKVQNDKIKQAVDNLLNNIAVGEYKSIISSDLELDIEGLKSIDVFNLTDVKEVDKLQYLSKYHDDLLRRLYTLGGHAMSGTQKMAQQSSYEIGQNDTISMIYPLARLKSLNKGLNEANRVFGLNMSAHFSEAWQTEKEKIETQIAVNNDMQSGKEDKENTDNESI